jgi:hypothetical protein
MDAPGRSLLRVTSILLIIFGAIDAFISIFSLACTSFLSNAATGITGSAAAGTAVGVILAIAAILLLAAGVLDLVLGIMGLKKCGDPAQANYFIICGIVLCVVPFISMVMSFQITSLIGFVLPALYIVGGYMNKKASTYATHS